MISADTRARKAFSPARRPTEYLLRENADLLSPVMVYRLTAEGFDLKDVQAMLALSELYSSRKIMSRIVGKSIRTLQRQGSKQDAHLNAQQSAVAFQFAKALEHAIKVFGSLRLAEEWLGRPCQHLGGDVPLDIIDNPVGFQAVEDYLERIEYGVYQ